MDIFLHTFEASGVRTWIFLPPLVAFVISFFTSMGGVSGAFLLLPFQVSVLGYSAPSVSATNQVYNVLAIPGGVWGYIRERRMLWPLTLAVILGTLPGVFVGAWIRVTYLPDPRNFKFFVGLVLLYIGSRLLGSVIGKGRSAAAKTESPGAAPRVVAGARLSALRGLFEYAGRTYTYRPAAVFALCLFIGAIGGVYGIGGGAIVAPILVTLFELPVHAVAGAALMGTFVTSTGAVVFYHVLAGASPELSIAPDWLLGALFAAGGIPGIYLGARCQKHFPASAIKAILCACVIFVAVKYILAFIR